MAQSIRLIAPNFSDLFEPNIEIGTFPDGDSHVRIPNLAECKNQEVLVFHRLYPKQNTSLVTLLLILDSLKQVGAKHVGVVAPYLPYSRQDKKKLNGEVASAYVVCNLLARAGCDKLITFDCHFLNQTGPAKFGELNIENISLGNELTAFARENFGQEPFEVVSPDAGSSYLVKDQGGKSFKKVRKDYDGDKIAQRDVETMECDFDINGRNFLVLDDMISTGGTMLRALEKLKECGAKKICCAATHGLFLYNCLDKIRKFTDCIYSSDSIVNSQVKVSIKDKLSEF